MQLVDLEVYKDTRSKRGVGKLVSRRHIPSISPTVGLTVNPSAPAVVGPKVNPVDWGPKAA